MIALTPLLEARKMHCWLWYALYEARHVRLRQKRGKGAKLTGLLWVWFGSLALHFTSESEPEVLSHLLLMEILQKVPFFLFSEDLRTPWFWSKQPPIYLLTHAVVIFVALLYALCTHDGIEPLSWQLVPRVVQGTHRHIAWMITAGEILEQLFVPF